MKWYRCRCSLPWVLQPVGIDCHFKEYRLVINATTWTGNRYVWSRESMTKVNERYSSTKLIKYYISGLKWHKTLPYFLTGNTKKRKMLDRMWGDITRKTDWRWDGVTLWWNMKKSLFSMSVKRRKRLGSRKKKSEKKIKGAAEWDNNEMERTRMKSSHIFTSQQGQYDLESHTAVNLECSKTVSYKTKSGQIDALNKVEYY